MTARPAWLRPVGALILTGALGCPPFEGGMRSSASASRGSRTDVAEKVVDVAGLRARYSERPELRARCESGRPLEQAFVQLDAAQWPALLTLTASWLEHCEIDIDFHRLRARALFEVGRKREASEHMRWYRELLAAALDSGDGASPESAYIVVSKSEEHALMRALELTPLRPIWVPDGVHGFEVRNRAGAVSTIYFNPSTRLSRLMREAPLEGERDSAR